MLHNQEFYNGDNCKGPLNYAALNTHPLKSPVPERATLGITPFGYFDAAPWVREPVLRKIDAMVVTRLTHKIKPKLFKFRYFARPKQIIIFKIKTRF